MANRKSYKEIAVAYAKRCVSGEEICGREVILAAARFLQDLKRDDIELHTKEPDLVIGIIERVMVHKQGETIEGESLMNKPLILQPWQVFIVYNLVGFYIKGTMERRYKEAFIFVPRKNGKTLFVASLAFGLAILERGSAAKIYIVSASMKQARESFEDIVYALRHRDMLEDFRVRNNNAEHSIHCDFFNSAGEICGTIDIEALAANPAAHDSFNCNLAIVDEVHALKTASQYNRFKEAMAAYTNRLIVGITTAGDNVNSFGYRRLDYAVKILEGIAKADDMFCFVSRADQDAKGNVDYTNPLQHRKANPSYGVTIRPADILAKSLEAQNDPQQRKDFLSRSLNIYSAAMRAWFDLDEFRASDRKYKWTIDELARLPIRWYGGADLSRMYDLTAAALAGHYNGTDIIITHGFFPVTQAVAKADQDNIPLFGWMDDGNLTMCNGPTNNMADIVNWFVSMRDRGFRIDEIGHDRKFAGEEYFPLMKAAGFNIVDQPQYFYVKSQGFRHIEKAAKDGNLYYLHSEAFEYCVSNVKAIEKTDDAVMYEKIQPELRIDLFDAGVFAVIRMINSEEKHKAAAAWWGE